MKPFDATTLAHEARIANLESKLAAALARIEKLEAPKPVKVPKVMDIAEYAQRARIREIAAEVAQKYQVTLERMKSHDRRAVFNMPRYEAWHLCHKEGITTPVIGRYFGGRDHTTILHGLGRYRAKAKAPESLPGPCLSGG